MATKAKAEDQKLPELFDGEVVTVASIDVKERKTRPPAHYNEGTLLDDMKAAAKFVEGDASLKRILKDASGLGTAATRDSIIEGLKNDGYIEKQGKHLIATDKGVKLILWLDTLAPDLTSVAVTARWEAELGAVAIDGGGKAFEAKVVAMVKNLITTLKTAPPISMAPKPFSTTRKETSSVTDSTNEPRKGTPTDKMLEFAKSIATKLQKPVPDEVMVDFDTCKKFIDDNKDAANRPSDKQLSFANSISQSKGVAIPPEALANGRELSRWIDATK
jgi:DNA topoisomerase-3